MIIQCESCSRKFVVKDRTIETKNDSSGKNDVLTLNNQAKSDKSEILVLDRMIE